MIVEHGAALSNAGAAVIAVHGRDQDPGYMVQHLIEPMGSGTDVDPTSVAWLLPAAPGGSWYPGRYHDPFAANQPDLDYSLATLSEARTRVAAAGIEAANIVWVGFSQGACLVLEYQLRHPERWAGVAALTGAVLGPVDDVRQVDGSLAGVDCYLAVGDRDPWMPPEAAHIAGGVLRAAGAEVTVEMFDSDSHEIRPAEVAAVARLIAGAASH